MPPPLKGSPHSLICAAGLLLATAAAAAQTPGPTSQPAGAPASQPASQPADDPSPEEGSDKKSSPDTEAPGKASATDEEPQDEIQETIRLGERRGLLGNKERKVETHETVAPYVKLITRGAHLTVDFTPTYDRFYPSDLADQALALRDQAREAIGGPPPIDEGESGSLSFILLPTFKYNPDEGFGAGVAIPIVWDEADVSPYKYSFTVQLVASTKLVQDYQLLYDIVDILGFPLRFTGAVGFHALGDEPFCGLGSAATCDPVAAQTAAANAGLTGSAAEEYAAKVYVMRLLRPKNWSVLRFKVFDFLGKWEIFGGLRSEWYLPGFFGNVFEGELFDPGPYADSALAARDPEGEPGYVNIPQVGLMVDSRDFEPSVRSGYWLESSARLGAPFLSSWNFVGLNTTLRFYVPLLPSKTLTWATRGIGDLIIGDAPVQELARVGGANDYRAFGGLAVGRGMRQQRHPGHLKLAYQTELRWDAIRFDVDTFSIGFEFLGFIDAGVVMADGIDYTFEDGLLRSPKPLVTGGMGFRWVINRTIIVRADLGFSREEGFVPQLYIDSGHIF